MDNEEYKNFFINRFLDRLNTGLKEEVVANRVEDYRALMTPIMPDHIARWPSAIPSMNAWKYGVNPIRTFGKKRPAFQRTHLIDYFELEDTVFNVTINNLDLLNGHVVLNTLEITDSMFNGLYLQGVPVQIEAVPYPGYVFSHWEENLVTDSKLSLSLLSDTSLTAVFIETPDIDYSMISVNEVYNGDSDTLIGTVDAHEWVEFYNSGIEPIDLSGLYLTDNDNLTRWMLPYGQSSIIQGQGFLIVHGDEDPTHKQLLEANFGKIKTGDLISLTKIRGTDTTVLSTLLAPSSLKSQGRVPDGSINIVLFDYHTFNATNTLYLDCNGDEKGGAELDGCEVCSGGNTTIEIDACVTSVDDEISLTNFSLSPNPVEYVTSLTHEMSWVLLDVNGVEVAEGLSTLIDMTGMPSGVYILQTELGRIKLLKI
jgi:hypothetical protein